MDELLKQRQDKLAKWKAKRLVPNKLNLGSLKRSKAPSYKLNNVKKITFDDDDDDDEKEGAYNEKSIQKDQRPTKRPHIAPAVDLDTLLTHLEKHESVKRVNNDAVLKDLELNEENENDHHHEDKDQINELLKRPNAKTMPLHEQTSYEIYKQLYQEHPMISSLTEEEISELRKRDMITIHGSKRNVKRPILTWNHLGLPKPIQDVLESMKFDEPTSIQCQSLPHIMNGEDFIGIAKTGSGKTLAYLLPMFRYLLANPLPKKRDEYLGSIPRAIILAPTRELAIQITKTAQLFCAAMKLRVCCCYGGQQISSQIAELRHSSGVDIIVGTPGRIIDLLCANQGKILKLTYVGYLVIDEADRMFDLGFEPQIIKILNEAHIRKDSQKVLFSATFPKKVELSVRKLLKNGVICKVGERNKVSEDVRQIIQVVGEPNQTKFEIEEAKVAALLQILGKWSSNGYGSNQIEHKCLIFTERQDAADKLVKKLISRGYVSMALHGGKDQGERAGVISDFTKGIIDIVVATSVAARGLDVEGLDLVINFDSPNHIEDYVHRIGRTGRAGKKGTAVTLLAINEERYAWDLSYIINQSKCLDGDIDPKLKILADSWGAKNKLERPKFSSGFGGKGLEKLQAIRDDLAKVEKDIYLEEKQVKSTEAEPIVENNNELVNVKYISNTETKVGARLFEAHLTINDLPQNARWAVSKGEFLAHVEEDTNVSIVVRGQYFADPQATGDKLYLMIESDIQNDVARAVAQLQRRILESLQSN